MKSTFLMVGLDMELGNAWPAVLSRGVESVAQASLGTRAQFARLEKKVREDWELDKRVAELFRPNLHTMSCG